MASFISTSFVGGADEAIQLGVEDWARTLTIGNAWTRIRIGILWQINSTLTVAGDFVFGICNGSTNTYNNTPNNFVGARITGSMAPVGGTIIAMWNGGMTWTAVKKRGSILTTGGSIMTAGPEQPFAANMASTARRTLMFIDILKGSPNYSVGLMYPSFGNDSAETTDFTAANLTSGMNVTYANTGIAGHTFFAGGMGTVAMDESTGALDTINLFFNPASFSINVYLISIYKLA